MTEKSAVDLVIEEALLHYRSYLDRLSHGVGHNKIPHLQRDWYAVRLAAVQEALEWHRMDDSSPSEKEDA